MAIDSNLLQNEVNLAGVARTMPNRWSNLSQSVGDFGNMLGNNYQLGQQLQFEQAKQLAQWKLYADMYGGSPQINSALANNPFGKFIYSASPTPAGQPQGQGFGMQPFTSPLTGQMMFAPTMGGGVPGGFNMSGASQPVGGQTSTIPQGGMGFNPLNPISQSPVITSGSQTMKTPFGESSTSVGNPQGAASMAAATEAGKGSVSPSVDYATKMAGSQALASENLARDKTQMEAVFQTLKNLHDIHSTLAGSKLSGTDFGNLASNNLGHLGTAAAIFGQKPEDWQNAAVSPENQNLIGQFQAGRNEGITRAIQPLQNQVDKVGSSRISESLLRMTEGEYGNLDDTRAQFDGKTLGTAKTLYRITLASQNYANDLKKMGISMNSNDSNFNPDQVAQTIYDNAKSIKLTPAQNKEFNQYANEILGTKNIDYSGPKAINPVGNQFSSGNSQQPQQPTQQTGGNVQQMLQAYKLKYPNRTDQEITTAMKRQGLI